MRTRCFAVTAALLLAARGARADEALAAAKDQGHPSSLAAAGSSGGAELDVGVGHGAVLHPPVVDGLGSGPHEPSVLGFDSQTFRQTQHQAATTLDLHLSFLFGPWNTPFLGLRFGFGTGDRDIERSASVNGAAGSLSLDSASFFEVLLPGLGLGTRLGSRGYVRAAVQPVFEHYTQSGTYTQGALQVPVSASSDTVGFDANADACLRMATWAARRQSKDSVFACLDVAPQLWRAGTAQEHLVNGVFVGLALTLLGERKQ